MCYTVRISLVRLGVDVDENIRELENKFWELQNEVVTAEELMSLPEGTIMLSRDGWAAQTLYKCLFITGANESETISTKDHADRAVKKWGPFKILHIFEREFKWDSSTPQ